MYTCIGDSTVKVIFYKHTINDYIMYMYGFRHVAIIS